MGRVGRSVRQAAGKRSTAGAGHGSAFSRARRNWSSLSSICWRRRSGVRADSGDATVEGLALCAGRLSPVLTLARAAAVPVRCWRVVCLRLRRPSQKPRVAATLHNSRVRTRAALRFMGRCTGVRERAATLGLRAQQHTLRQVGARLSFSRAWMACRGVLLPTLMHVPTSRRAGLFRLRALKPGAKQNGLQCVNTCKPLMDLVAWGGIEPPTRGFSMSSACVLADSRPFPSS